MSDPATSGVLVLGMHRSGTSALAGMLQAAGFHAAGVDEWDPNNLKGSRENLRAVRLNDALLDSSGGAWDAPPASISSDGTHQAEGQSIIEDLRRPGRPWMLKDPRTLLALDFWRTLAPEARLVGVFRHPLAVAHSLERRNAMPTERALDLWLDYNDRLLQAWQRQAFPLLQFSPEGHRFLYQAGAAIKALFPARPDAPELRLDRMAAFFDDTLVNGDPARLPGLSEAWTSRGDNADRLARVEATWQQLTRAQVEGGPGDAPDEPLGLTTRMSPDDRLQALASAIEQSGITAQRIDDARRLIESSLGPAGWRNWLERWLERYPAHPVLLLALARQAWSGDRQDDALWLAAQCHDALPDWTPPVDAMAKWQAERGNPHETAVAIEQLGGLQQVIAGDWPAQLAQVYYDPGTGFSEADSVRMTWLPGDSRYELHFDMSSEHRALTRLRFDPALTDGIFEDVSVFVESPGHDSRPASATESNAIFVNDGRYHFNGPDPWIEFELPGNHPARIHQVRVAFTCHALGQAAVARNRDTMARAAGAAATGLRETRRQWAVIQSSLSWRVGSRLVRLLMSPLTLGFGKTALDDFESTLDAQQERPDRRR